MALGPPSSQGEDSPKLIAISSQASPQAVMPDNNELSDQTPEEVHTPTKGLCADDGILPKEVISLQEEMNRAMECLHMTRSSLDTHQRKQVSDFQVALFQNQDVATKTIREAKVHCMVTVREAESHCAVEIRRAESYSMAQAHSIQQSHSEGMQHLKTDALEEEGRDHLSFLTACRAALQACPLNALGGLMYPLHLLTGNMSLATLLSPPHQASTTREESTLMLTPGEPTSLPGAKCPHLPNQMCSLPLLEDATGTNDEPPHLKWKEGTFFMASLKGDQQEAFAKDSLLVQKAMEDYFKAHHPHFNHETLQDLSNLFQDMIMSTDLLNSEIFKIQEKWTRQEDLQATNDPSKALPKGLQFFQTISLMELPKVMGLEGIHHPDALHHFASVTFCPWCGKVGQNEGTIVNHLWTTHYRLRLVCEKCLCSYTTASEAMQCHG